MGLLGAVSRLVKGDDLHAASSVLPVVDDGCKFECDSCMGKYPSSLKIDTTTPLWGSAKPWRSHLLIATGKSDWTHDIADEKGTLSAVLGHWSPKDAPGRVIVSNSSLPVPMDYHVKGPENRTSSILVLPLQLYASGVSMDAAQNVADELTKYKSPPSESELPKEISGAQVSRRSNLAVVLLCSHGKRDKRCAVTAPILKKEFEMNLREHDLLRDSSDDRPNGVQIYYVSHVGGHKFAGNVIIYRNTGEGIWMGRIEPKHVKAIVEETIMKGKVFPSSLRGAFSSDW
ncbi:Sucraseferredoxin-like protein [Dipodascopsis uninucleata]